jgi:hypothetical protein
MGLTAEHFKKGGKTIANYTAALLKIPGSGVLSH